MSSPKPDHLQLYPYCERVREALEKYPEGLTCYQLAALASCTPEAARQAVYLLRRAGHHVRADRVFRLRKQDGQEPG